MAVTKNELRERELIKHFRHEGTWLSQIPSKNQWVNNDVIKINEIGGDPAVLIDNNTYPIPTSGRTDGELAISLHKYDTDNTEVTDDELYGLPYDKLGSVQQQHREALEEKTLMHALHSITPMQNTAETPVMETTGADDGTGRKRMTKADLINFRLRLDKLKIPQGDRLLILSSTHLADLMLEDVAIQNRMMNHVAGQPAPMLYGFKIYQAAYAPVFDATTKEKLAFDAIGGGLDASVFCYTKRAAKARGSVKAYMSKAADNPEYRSSKLGFRIYHIAIPLSKLGQGAIIDGTV